MKKTNQRLNLDQQAAFQITIQAELDAEWSAWFDNMTLTVADGMTTLSGSVADQPALHSLLAKIRDLGLPLVSLKRIE